MTAHSAVMAALIRKVVRRTSRYTGSLKNRTRCAAVQRGYPTLSSSTLHTGIAYHARRKTTAGPRRRPAVTAARTFIGASTPAAALRGRRAASDGGDESLGQLREG